MGDAAPQVSCHWEVLASEQRKALEQIAAALRGKGWYLGGGTGLALLLGHRRSVDLDWFTSGPVRGDLLARELSDRGVELSVDSIASGTLHARLWGVRASFFEFPYPLLDSVRECREAAVEVGSLADLSCMKLLAAVQRGSRKDLVDVWAVVKEGLDLSKLLELYRRKFAVGDVRSVLDALTFFDDAERQPMPEMLWQVDWEDVVRNLRRWTEAVWRSA